MGIVVAKEEKERRSRDWPFLRCCPFCCCDCETDQGKADYHRQVMEPLRFSWDQAKDGHWTDQSVGGTQVPLSNDY